MPLTLLALKQLLSKPVCWCSPKRIKWWKDVPFNFIAFGLMLCVFISGCNKTAVIDQSEASSLYDNHNTLNLDLQVQNPHVLNLRFEHISVEDGLAQNDAISIIQDREGFMWFGSEDGLNRYDGKNISVFKHDPEIENSLCDNWIWDIYEIPQASCGLEL